MKLIKNIWYFSFWLYVRLTLKFYYKNIKVSGKENIPKNVPIIFGSNHENALIDPLIMTTRLPKTIYYLVRADVFNNVVVRKFLNSLNLMPVYRIRDGAQSVQANKQIFKNCFEAFKKGHSLMLYPEAAHDIRRVERFAKKGISRIALGAMNEVDAPKELYIVPMGLSYSAHKVFRSTVHVIYGKPIKVEQQPETKVNMDAIKDAYDAAVKPCYISLNRDKFPVLDKVFFHGQSPKDLIDPLEINPKGEALVPHITEEIEQQFKETTEAIEKEGISFPFEKKDNYWLNGLLAIFLAPFALIGVIGNAPVLGISTYVMKGIKDKVFNDTIFVGVGLFLGPITWFGIYKLMLTISGEFNIALGVALFMPISLLLLGKMRRHWRIFSQNKTLNASSSLQENYRSLMNQIDELLAKA